MRETFSFLAELFGAFLVQCLMLCQCSVTYIILRIRNRSKPIPPNVFPLRDFSGPGHISIIIPAYKEVDTIGACLQRLNDCISEPNLVEVIVVDAGGGDGTMEKVREAAEGSLSGLTLRTANLPHDSKGGRGATLIAGVAASKGDIILFLHADTVVLPGFDGLLRSELAKDSVLATAFSFGVNRDSVVAPIAGLAWMEWTVNIRSSILELPFGDQAIAMTRQRLDAVGGVPDVPIMEDFELVQKLRRIGAAGSGRIKTLDAKVLCSGRRWQEKGVWRTNLLNQVIMTAYVYFGFTPAQIYSWYYSVPFLRSGDGKTKAS